MTLAGRERASRSSQATLPVGVAIAHFLFFYGPALYRGWDTRDGMIPVRLFWFLYRAIPRVAALERIHQATATATGIGLAMSDPAKARTLLASLMAAAFEGEG